MSTVEANLSAATASGIALVAVVFAACMVFLSAHLTAHAYARIEARMREEIVLSYAEADWEYQSTQKASRMQGRLRLADARARIFGGLVGWSRGAATLVVFVAVAAIMSPIASLLILTCGAVLSLAVFPIRRLTSRVAGRTSKVDVGLTDDFGDAVDQGPDVQIFGAWPAFIDRFRTRSEALRELRARAAQLRALLLAVYQYGAFALIVLILFSASQSNTSAEVGEFAASALLLLRGVQYGQLLQLSLHDIAACVPKQEVLDRELVVPTPRLKPGDRELVGVDRVELRDVSYRYPGSDRLALDGVSLDLNPGSIIGLAGPSGSGKSTLAQVLLRLRWPTSGEYLVNGRNAGEYSAVSWFRLVSHLPQQPHLLHASLADNVGFLDESIPEEAILASLQAVDLRDLVDALPGGLDAELGPSGRNLSGGQVQRIGIARALSREPRLVVLDEPTSALDVQAERLVGEALAALRGKPGVLVVVIAHRPSTLALCDQIVVLQGGRITGFGHSEDLARRNGFFAATWS